MAKVSEQVNRKFPTPPMQFYNLQSHIMTISLKTFNLLHYRCWCQLASTLQTYFALCYLFTFLYRMFTFSASKQTGIKSRLPFETVNN